MSAQVVGALRDLAKENHNPNLYPSYLCQWVPTEDGLHIEWDGEENFYGYLDWIAYVVMLLSQKLYTVSGKVMWHGESVGDMGLIEVEENEVFVNSLPCFNPGDRCPIKIWRARRL